jgi:hypothetical protein
MAQIIVFVLPSAYVQSYVVLQNGEEVLLMNNARNARNAARIISYDWPGSRVTVETNDGEEIFSMITEEE